MSEELGIEKLKEAAEEVEALGIDADWMNAADVWVAYHEVSLPPAILALIERLEKEIDRSTFLEADLRLAVALLDEKEEKDGELDRELGKTPGGCSCRRRYHALA